MALVRIFAWRLFVISSLSMAFFRLFVFSLGVLAGRKDEITPGEKTTRKNATQKTKRRDNARRKDEITKRRHAKRRKNKSLKWRYFARRFFVFSRSFFVIWRGAFRCFVFSPGVISSFRYFAWRFFVISSFRLALFRLGASP